MIFNAGLISLDYTDMVFSEIKTDKMVSFPENVERKQQRAAKRQLLTHLQQLLEVSDQGTVLKVDIYFKKALENNTHQTNMAIFYFADKTVIPTLIQGSASWQSWVNDIAGPYDDGVLSTITQSGVQTTALSIFNAGDPYKNTGRWIVANAPKAYLKQASRDEKQDFLGPFINIEQPILDNQVLSHLLQQWLSRGALEATVVKDNAAIYQRFETEAGFAMPDALKVLYQQTGGIERFHQSSALLSAAQVMQEWQNWQVIYKDWTLQELTSNNLSDHDKTLGIYTTPYWVPFLHDGAGNFLAIDHAPNKKGTPGQIIAFGADALKTRFIAENMQDFLQQLVDGKEAPNNGLDQRVSSNNPGL